VERLLLKTKAVQDPDTARLIGRSSSIGVFSLIGMSALGTAGVDTAPLLTGIGVTGFTIGFALKEIATNFLSGMLLVISRPFRKGQYLRVLAPSIPGGSIEGEVVSIDAKHVLLKSKMGGIVMVPSVIVYTSTLHVTTSPSTTNPTTANSNIKEGSN
jgi:small-conductance mechanosensitive channel